MHEEFAATFEVEAAGHVYACTYSYDLGTVTVAVEGHGSREVTTPHRPDDPELPSEVESLARKVAMEILDQIEVHGESYRHLS